MWLALLLTAPTLLQGWDADAGLARNWLVSNSGALFVNADAGAAAPSGMLSVFAGSFVTAGHTNAAGASARFNAPQQITSDGTTFIYVADMNNNTMRRVAMAGAAVTDFGTAISTINGIGWSDAGGVYGSVVGGDVWESPIPNSTSINLTSGSADNPQSVGYDFHGTIWTGNGDVGGIFAPIANTYLGSDNYPIGLSFDSAGTCYEADALSCCLFSITIPGGVETNFAGNSGVCGAVDGTGTFANFNGPQGIVYDGHGVLYVADTNNSAIRRVVISTGVVTTVVGVLGHSGLVTGPLPGGLVAPIGVTYNYTTSSLYISDGNAILVATPVH